MSTKKKPATKKKAKKPAKPARPSWLGVAGQVKVKALLKRFDRLGADAQRPTVREALALAAALQQNLPGDLECVDHDGGSAELASALCWAIDSVWTWDLLACGVES